MSIRGVCHGFKPALCRSFATKLSWIKVAVTDQNKEAVEKAIWKIYKKEVCGICDRPGVEKTWLNPGSSGAHRVCVARMAGVETVLHSLLKDFFPSEAKIQEVHSGVVGIVKAQLKGLSILSALELDEEKFKSILYSDETMEYIASKAVDVTMHDLERLT